MQDLGLLLGQEIDFDVLRSIQRNFQKYAQLGFEDERRWYEIVWCMGRDQKYIKFESCDEALVEKLDALIRTGHVELREDAHSPVFYAVAVNTN